MSARKHLILLLQAVGVWGAFWVAGLPAYYQQYEMLTMAIACILLSVLISLAAVFVLRQGRESTRMTRALWLSVYYTVPFLLLDALYCGWYLGHGWQFVSKYWYLSIFYVTPWLTFMPTVVSSNVRLDSQHDK
jgi:hypothetical protein